MSPEQVRELWSRFLAGEEISAEDQRGLVDALDADPELRESLLDNLQLDGMLQAMNTTRRQGEGFVRDLTECLDVEHDGTRFVQKVELRLNEPDPPPQGGAGTGRRSKPPTTRLFRRRPTASASGESAWKPALIAAAAFVAILLVVTSSTRTAPPRPLVTNPPRPGANPDPGTAQAEPKPEVEAPRGSFENEQPRRTEPAAPNEKPEDRQKALAATEEERKRIEEEIRAAIVQRAPSATPPAENGKTSPAATTAGPAAAPTVVERLSGNVYLARNAGDKRRAQKDAVVPVGWDVETPGNASAAMLRFGDRTWVEVGPNSVFRELSAPTAAKGRQVFLAGGTLDSHITKQSPDRPMVFLTPAGEATILGTTIRLTVSHDAKAGTTLEVKEGKVRLTNLDGKSVEVVTGQFAVAAAGAEMTPRKSFPDETLVKFGPADVPLKPGWVLDSGETYDAARGYGWLGPKDGPPVPGIFWRDPATQQLIQKRSGRLAARRTTQAGADPLRTTDVVAGWAGQTETWKMPVPNGRYLVSVCCGDISYEQGPHHVWIEGFQVIDQKKNKAGQFVEVLDFGIEVRDGELTMVVGGNPGKGKSVDGSTDTILNYLIIKRVDPRKK